MTRKIISEGGWSKKAGMTALAEWQGQYPAP
jgi:hypothetical protein